MVNFCGVPGSLIPPVPDPHSLHRLIDHPVEPEVAEPHGAQAGGSDELDGGVSVAHLHAGGGEREEQEMATGKPLKFAPVAEVNYTGPPERLPGMT